MDTPVLVFDGDCAFCTSSVRVLKRCVAKQPEIVAWQHADLEALQLTIEACTEALQWKGSDGSHRSGAAAVAATLRYAGKGWRVIGITLDAPGVRWIAARIYRWVSNNRHRLPGGSPACAVEPPTNRPTSSSPGGESNP